MEEGAQGENPLISSGLGQALGAPTSLPRAPPLKYPIFSCFLNLGSLTGPHSPSPFLLPTCSLQTLLPNQTHPLRLPPPPGSNSMASAHTAAQRSHLWPLPTDWKRGWTQLQPHQVPLLGSGTTLACRTLLAARHPEENTQSAEGTGPLSFEQISPVLPRCLFQAVPCPQGAYLGPLPVLGFKVILLCPHRCPFYSDSLTD